MRFCPKCSLKIKGTITQCPLCKVELLSCADDEEMDIPSSDHLKQSKNDGPVGNHPRTSDAAGPPTPSSGERPVSIAPSSATPPTAVIPAEIEKFIEKMDHKLSVHIAKEEVITRSLVELESKLNALQKSLQDFNKSSASLHERLERMEKKGLPLSSPERLSRPGTVHPAQPAGPGGGSPRTAAPPSFEQATASSDFPPSGPMTPEESPHFFSEPPDDFDLPLGQEEPCITGTPVPPHPGKGRRTFVTFATIIILSGVLTALAFYYKTLQDRPDQQRIITEEINIPSPPDQTMKSLPEQGVVPRQADMPESIATPAPPPPDAVSTVAVQEEPPQSPPLQPEQPPKPTLAFTVSVGTFKDKANAIALTSKLVNKGYPASTAHSTKRELFRVIVGSFPTREEAIPMARILAKKENLPTAVVTTAFP